jgi:hypothetical protein
MGVIRWQAVPTLKVTRLCHARSVATLEPSIAVQTCEDALRQLMSYAYSEAYGASWIEKISSKEQREEWNRRYKQEVEKRRPRGGLAIEPPHLTLAYSDMSDLLGFVKNHWEPLAPALFNRHETRALLSRFEVLRNTAMHSRAPLIFEQELMSGIAGQIRNQVAMYLNKQDRDHEYYPRIESITDCFGYRFEGVLRIDQISYRYQTFMHLTPSIALQYTCIGVDPQERDLYFSLRTHANPQVAPISGMQTASGQPATLEWPISEQDVRIAKAAYIRMSSVGSKYHRFTDYDQEVFFAYQVNPPRE